MATITAKIDGVNRTARTSGGSQYVVRGGWHIPMPAIEVRPGDLVTCREPSDRPRIDVQLGMECGLIYELVPVVKVTP